MKNYKVKIIAEAGVNHNGSLEKAKLLIKEAKKCGADYVKFQAFNPNELCTENSIKANYQKKNNPKESQYLMLKRLALSKHDILKINSFAKKVKIKLMFSVFDNESLKLINRLKFDYIKLPSGEINNFKLINDLSKSHSNLIFSSGASNLMEIKNCLKKLKKYNHQKVVLMHCNSEYPTPTHDLNLNVIKSFRKIFKIDIGFSDHSISTIVPAIAVSCGAIMIEKHFTLNNKSKGPDHSSSLNPKQFKIMVDNIRETEIAMGSYTKKITKSEKKNLNIIRKSIVAKKIILKNEKFSILNTTTKRPGGGIPASKYFEMIGKVAKKNYKTNEKIKN